MKFLAIFAAAAALTTPAAAQDAHAGHEAHAEQEATAAVTDAELAEFVDIVMQGQGIQNNETMSDADKQSAMITMISESEMGMARFTEVATAVGQDEALQQRVQSAVMQRLGAAAQ